jgi:TonB family protein
VLPRLCVAALLVELLFFSSTRAHQEANNAPTKPCKLIVVRQPKPKWPDKLTGSKSIAAMRFTVERSGLVSHIKVIKSSGNNDVDKALVEALRQTVYKPLNGECDSIESTIQVNIDLSAGVNGPEI